MVLLIKIQQSVLLAVIDSINNVVSVAVVFDGVDVNE